MVRTAFLPLPTYPDALSDEATARAVSMAAAIGASVHAATFAIDIRPVGNMLSRFMLDVPELARKAETRSRAAAERLAAAVRQAAADANVPLADEAIVCEEATLGDRAADLARYFDLSLIAVDTGTDTDSVLAEAILFGSGRPALLVPDATLPGRIGHVALAWDGSRVAARAVADAMPFLLDATSVSILTVVDEKPIRDPEVGVRLARALAAKGIAAQPVGIEIEDRAIAASLQDHAVRRGADMLVMGGYGHSRFRDFVLGGATKGVLADTRLPILLSH